MRSNPQDNASLHAWSLAGMGALLVTMTGAAFFGGAVFGGGPAIAGPDLGKLEAIEASIAYKKAPPKSQPQKPKTSPEPVDKPVGVSRDENQAPVTKPDEVDKKAGDKPTLDDFKRRDTDLDEGKVVDPTSSFDEDRFGWANETKGEPYVQDLLADLIQAGGDYPTLAASEGFPIGCFHMNAEGKILDTLMREKADPPNAELDDFAERSLNGLKKKRNDSPIPIDLTNDKLRPLMTEWTCFRFNLGS